MPEARETCGSCDTDFALSNTTALLRIYISEPSCNHIMVQCPECGIQWGNFRTTYTLARLFAELDLQTTILPYPEEELLDSLRRPPEEPGLTPRVVDSLTQAIQGMSDDAFWESLLAPTDGDASTDDTP